MRTATLFVCITAIVHETAAFTHPSLLRHSLLHKAASFNAHSEESSSDPSAFHGISSHELRHMKEAKVRKSESHQTSKSFVSGDDLQSLRREVLSLNQERQKLLTANRDPHRVAELEQAIWQAQQVDAEYVYYISQLRAEKAEEEGDLKRAQQHRKQAKRARSELPQFNLDGLWVGRYGNHGFEMINITYAGDTMIAYKVTDNDNVPSGEVSFTVDLSPNPKTIHGETPLLEPIELNHDAAEQWGLKYLPRFTGRGQVARKGFRNAQWVEGQLILVNKYFSFAWLPIGHQVFFGRPSAELTLKMLRESRSKRFADESSRAFLTRCWEETAYIEDDMDVTDGIFKSHDQSFYYDQAGCFE
ncbi:hypothetical protein FisN_1Hh589 [Fistulifera solaris]|uniref:Uncharacterized protein n=1 Tax=Fistulifera solaris TaxID=1519565 RepID=A0A1Z5KQN3_FISSO|nr:hypothetical protein FisN_1Hh589 [Fistulifera solaris]|eukprot:GAX28620.1 hypothetical protein FisN_1Hh589 [Fistulifera solaris]